VSDSCSNDKWLPCFEAFVSTTFCSDSDFWKFLLKSPNLKERKYFREKKAQRLIHFSDKYVRNNLLEVILSHGLDVIFVFLVKSSSVSFLPLTCRFTEQVFSIHCPWKLSGRLAQRIVGLTAQWSRWWDCQKANNWFTFWNWEAKYTWCSESLRGQSGCYC